MAARLCRGFFTASPLRPRTFWQTPKHSTLQMSSVGGATMGAGLYAAVSAPAQAGAKPEDAELKAHHLKSGKGFLNPWDSYKDIRQWELMWGVFSRKLTGASNKPDTTPPTVPVHTPTFLPTRDTPKLRATWLGHACYYVEFPGGLRVLFDPVFEDCCSPVNVKALRRFTPPPCEIEDLPAVDVVVISHNHYDHLSYPTIQRLQARFPHAHYFAPLGNKSWFTRSGVTHVTELDWWDTRDVRLEPPASSRDAAASTSTSPPITATIGALPCQHVSARTPFDKCATLWASWSVSSGGASVYFAGDTGYRSVPSLPADVDDYGPEYAHLPVCPAFAQIGALRGPFDLGLIPIGAYAPRWMFSPMHADPKDAVNIFADTKCRKALGMHWGTWVLTEEDVMEPPRKLKEALVWKGVSEAAFRAVDIGETTEVDAS